MRSLARFLKFALKKISNQLHQIITVPMQNGNFPGQDSPGKGQKNARLLQCMSKMASSLHRIH